MSQEYIEVTEKTVSEAIMAACQRLGVPSERLEYDVIDPGKTGFLGIGSRAAKIRARVKQGMEDSTEFDTSAIISDVLKGKDDLKKSSDQRAKEKKKEDKKETRKKDFSKDSSKDSSRAEKTSAKKTEQTSDKAPEKEEAAYSEASASKEVPAADHKAAADESVNKKEKNASQDNSNSGRKGSGRRDSSEKNFEKGNRERGRGRRRQRRFEKDEYAAGSRDHEQERSAAAAEARTAPKKKSAVPVLTDEQIEEIKQRADTFLSDVFQAMNLEAEVKSTYDRETGMLTIDMKGDNMGVLIGKRGQTLDSLQYLVSLVVNKGIDGYIHVKADTENYRERRKKTLENLAKNIAAKVKRNRTSVALEPMNPYERRIIHSALQSDRYVTTYSEGEEPYRKVIVTMKEDR